MITPAEIQKKAQRQYSAFLTAVLNREPFFPLYIKGKKGKASDDYETLFRGIRQLLEGEKQKMGYGYTVTLKKVNTRHAGEISMPNTIFFKNVEDYIKFINKEAEFLAFRKAVQQTHKQLPEFKKWMAIQPLKVIKYLPIWQDLLKVGVFFLENPQPNMYAREIPILPVATFIEDNIKIVTELLNAILPQSTIEKKETIFEKRFGLKYDEQMIHIRSLDGNLGGLPVDNLALTAKNWEKIPLNSNQVFIITNQLDFLRFPKMQNAIAILGTPTVLNELEQLIGLENKQLYFWTDLNLQGATLLSSIRAKFPLVQSFLMTLEVLEKYQNCVENVKVSEQILITHLTTMEQDVVNELLKGRQLLQKHIVQEDIEIALEVL